MSTQAIAVQDHGDILDTASIKRNRLAVTQLLKDVFVKDVDYGIIPGCKKPSLYKPGAEKIAALFHINIEYIVENLSTGDTASYSVTARATSIGSGIFLGSAVGFCSSEESKYKWRAAISVEEFDAMDALGRARKKYVQNGSIPQVRTEHADIANTILQMAAKRGFIAVVKNITAASDAFTHGVEDLPPEVVQAAEDENQDAEPVKPQGVQPAAKTGAAPSKPAIPKPASESVISDAQARRFYAMWKGNGKTKEEVANYLLALCGVMDDRQMPVRVYQEACDWTQGK